MRGAGEDCPSTERSEGEFRSPTERIPHRLTGFPAPASIRRFWAVGHTRGVNCQ